MARGRLWVEVVNAATAEIDAAEGRPSIRRDRLYGSDDRARATARRLGPGYRPPARGRPRSADDAEIAQIPQTVQGFRIIPVLRGEASRIAAR